MGISVSSQLQKYFAAGKTPATGLGLQGAWRLRETAAAAGVSAELVFATFSLADLSAAPAGQPRFEPAQVAKLRDYLAARATRLHRRERLGLHKIIRHLETTLAAADLPAAGASRINDRPSLTPGAPSPATSPSPPPTRAWHGLHKRVVRPLGDSLKLQALRAAMLASAFLDTFTPSDESGDAWLAMNTPIYGMEPRERREIDCSAGSRRLETPPRPSLTLPAPQRQPPVEDRVTFATPDAPGVAWPDPERADDACQLLQDMAALVRQGIAGTELEAEAFARAFARPVDLEDETGARRPLYSGGLDERGVAPLVLCHHADGAWGVPGSEPAHDADALYRAIMAALALADPNVGTRVAELREAVAERLGGVMRPRGDMDVARAEVAAVNPHWPVYRPSFAADEAPAVPTPAALARGGLGVWQMPGTGWVAVELTAQPVRCAADMQDHVAFVPDPGQPPLHAVLAYLRARESGMSGTAARDCVPQLIASTAATATEGAARNARAAAKNLHFHDGVVQRLRQEQAKVSPQGQEALLTQRAAFDAKFPYSPFLNDDERTVVNWYLIHMGKRSCWGNDLVAEEIGRLQGAVVRLWSREGKDLDLCVVHELASPTRPPIDLINVNGYHYTCVGSWKAGVDLPLRKPDGLFRVPLSACRERDMGGSGDCLFRSAAYALDLEGVRTQRGTWFRLGDIALDLRRQVVRAWTQVLQNPTRGDRARQLVEHLVLKAQDEALQDGVSL